MAQMELDTFTRAVDKMVAANDASSKYKNYFNYERPCISKQYTPEEINNIIADGTLQQRIALSNYFYSCNNMYRRLILHYATLPLYSGVLIPHGNTPDKIKSKTSQATYFKALDFIEKMRLPELFIECARRAYIEGCAYGIKSGLESDKGFGIIFLTSTYCRTRFKDMQGNDVLEFDLSYFDSVYGTDEEAKNRAIASFPKEIIKAYKKYKKGTIGSWVFVPSDLGICFSFYDGNPFFISIIQSLVDYDKTIDLEQVREQEDIKKILINHIPHNTQTDALVFEPDEAEEMHRGLVNMLKKNPAYTAVTSYGDITVADSHVADANNRNLLNMANNVYYNACVNGSLFGMGTYSSLNASLQNDLNLIAPMLNKFSNFVTTQVNELFSNSNIHFKYIILPITEYNRKDYIDSTTKLATYGYSFLLPAIGSGLTQRDLTDVKYLENNVLGLDEFLVPLSSSNTQSGKEEEKINGRPTKAPEEKTETTNETDAAENNQ